MELFIVKKVSRKEGKEPFSYLSMYLDLGYTTLNITMDKNIIMQVSDMKPSELYALEENEPFCIGKLELL